MIGAIVGDFIGSVGELTLDKAEKNEKIDFSINNIITDDSILTVATASALLLNESFAYSYFSHFHNSRGNFNYRYGSRFRLGGYGPYFTNWCENWYPGHKCESLGNGAAMRVSPVAWVSNDEDEVLELAYLSAANSHDHPEAIASAQGVALAILLARNGVGKQEALERISERFQLPIHMDLDYLHDEYAFSSRANQSVPHAISCVYHANSFMEVMQNCLYIGGDTDTIGAIAGSIAEPLFGVEPELKHRVMEFLRIHKPYDLGLILEFEKRYGFNKASSGSASDFNFEKFKSAQLCLE